MRIHIFSTKDEMASAAANCTAEGLQAALHERGAANLILATGASQFDMLAELVKLPVDWTRVTVFHLDEYIGLPESHPASFRKYLKERFAARVSGLKSFHYVNGSTADPREECARLGELIRAHPIDVACIGIGENGHLAFNDPPADFETEEPYLIVTLDEACRKQQLGEGWFPSLTDVPHQAISMSIRQILKSERIVCTVPDTRKATAVRGAVKGPVTNHVPASILQNHSNCDLYLDAAAAAGL